MSNPDSSPAFPVRPRRLMLIELGTRAAPFFAELALRMAPTWQCTFYSRRPVVRSSLRHAGLALAPARLRGLPPSADPTPELRCIIGDKALQTETPAALRRAAALLQELAALFDAQRPDGVLVWNGSGLVASIAVHLARARHIPVVFGENGYLPATLQLDPDGVNQFASITALAAGGQAFLPADPALDERLESVLADYRSGRAPPLQRAMRTWRPSWSARLRRELARLVRARSWMPAAALDAREFPARLDPLPARFVLVPFQVSQDSQLILHSPVVGADLRRFLAQVHAAVRAIDPGLAVVVKLHPAESSRVLATYRDLPRRYPDVRFTTAHPLADLLSACAAVVTINSTVGFEGLVFGKPVIALGRNFYVGPGLARAVTRVEDLEPVLRAALAEPVDAERVRGFLRYVYFRFLTHASYRDFSEPSLCAVAQRIDELTGPDA